jgi:hypothetical protein
VKKRKLFLLFLIWLLGVFLVLNYFEVSLDLDPLLLVYGVGIFFLTRIIWAWNWSSLNEAVGLGHDYVTLFKGTFLCAFTDTFTPPIMPSAELAMAYYLSKKMGKRFSSYLPVIFLQSTFMVGAQFIVFVGGGLLLGGVFFHAISYLVAILLALTVMALFVWNFKKGFLKWVVSLSFRRVEGLEKAVGRMVSLFFKKKLLVSRVFLLEICNVLIEASVVYFLIGGKVDLLAIQLLSWQVT